MYALAQLNLLYNYLSSKKKHDNCETFDLNNPSEVPFVTVQLPVFNEMYVMERLLDNIALLDYPKDKLEIQVLDDSTDETGKRVEWRFDNAGEFVVKLSISDGTRTSTQERTVTVYGAEVQPPSAEITSFSSDEDCTGEDPDTGNYILIWLCPEDKENNDRRIDETATIPLDASESEAGSNQDYISEWRWDLDLNDDSDNDGDMENDADLSGEEVDWTDVAPGEYEVSLTIVNGGGMTDSTKMKVYVNYAAFWKDFEIGGNTSNSAVDINFAILSVS